MMIYFPVMGLSNPDEGDTPRSSSDDDEFTEEPFGGQRLRSLSTRAMTAAANAISSPPGSRPSVVFSSDDDACNSPLKRIQNKMSRVLKGLSQTADRTSLSYNPEVLTKQKRQWASFQLQTLDHRSFKEPSKLFESMVVVGLHPGFDVHTLRKRLIARKSEVSGKSRFALSGQKSSRVEPDFEPQVLFAYPSKKELPLKYKDLLSFCFPGGVEVQAIEKSSSMSELNEILLGQAHLKQSKLSFVFRLQVPDNSTLYGCCVLVDELVDKPSRLISMISDSQSVNSCLGRYIFTTRRCYCIISRVPCFELHFGVLNRIFMEERLEHLTKSIAVLDMELPDMVEKLEDFEENASGTSQKHDSKDEITKAIETPLSSSGETTTVNLVTDGESPKVSDTGSHSNNSLLERIGDGLSDSCVNANDDRKALLIEEEPTGSSSHNSKMNGLDKDSTIVSQPNMEKFIPGAVRSLLYYQQLEGFDSASFQDFSCEDRHIRSDNDDADTGEASTSGQEGFRIRNEILEWAKANNHGSLQIICEYHMLDCPPRNSTITFQPLEHLQHLEYHRPAERVVHISGSLLDLRLCKTSLERAEVLNVLIAEEEADALSTWTLSCICGSMRLEHVLTLFAGALLEKQIVFVCSNLGLLSASVLSLIPLIRPYQWQSLLMPVLPNDMVDFLDAPVPYIVGVQSRTPEVQSKLTSAIVVDVSKNQVKSPSMPQLPKQRELFAALSPYHSKLVGESYLGRKRPIYECNEAQVEAAKGFILVLRNYLDSLCCNLRSHTITNVQSNDDKVSLLLKESFIDSFPSRDRSFMKFFVDTQLFSVHTDLVLSFYQKE